MKIFLRLRIDWCDFVCSIGEQICGGLEFSGLKLMGFPFHLFALFSRNLHIQIL